MLCAELRALADRFSRAATSSSRWNGDQRISRRDSEMTHPVSAAHYTQQVSLTLGVLVSVWVSGGQMAAAQTFSANPRQDIGVRLFFARRPDMAK